MTMDCTNCGGKLASRRADRAFSALPSVTLINLEVRKCSSCGTEYDVIPLMEPLFRGVVDVLIRKASRLRGDEIRFLRKFLGWSQVVFAAYMGVDKATANRWERDENPMGVSSDRLLRLMVAYSRRVENYLDDIKKVATEEGPRTNLRAHCRPGGWDIEEG